MKRMLFVCLVASVLSGGVRLGAMPAQESKPGAKSEPPKDVKPEPTQQAKSEDAPAPPPMPPQEKTITDLILTQDGDLPIILSAPHGGQLPVPGAQPREGTGLKTGPTGYVTVRDVNTDLLALALSHAIETRMGKKPYYVVARFARKYADANRPAGIAYEDANARPVYDAYHHTLTRYCRQVRQTFGRGLLIDIHGQAAARDTIFRGTGDGKTVTLLIKRYGAKAHVGPESLTGLLTARGCKVFPAEAGKEKSSFNGGYITQHYGDPDKSGMDAIQLEFGGEYTSKANRKETAAKLADAIAEFAHLYLPDKPLDNSQ